MEYRPANYWGWLGDMNPEESAWQIEQMHKAGLGGYVAHSRGGRLVPYMGKEWMDSVRATVDAGKKYGMMTIMDDEDGWPSGFGAGIVNNMGEDYQVKWLICEEVEKFDDAEKKAKNFLGFYQFEGKKVKISHGIDRYYVDNMDPKVVEEFIDANYASYYESFGDEFYGIFSDEPELIRYAVPWSDIIPEEFGKRHGYGIKENLHALFYDVDGCEKVRFDFWKLVAELFEISYAKKIGDWCRAHNILFTGHTTLEETLAWQMQCSGSTMQFYEWFDIPGMDWLCRVGVSDMAAKQLTSVGEQLGKQRILSEMYGCAGWNIGFDDMKWIAEWHYALGVNYMLQHLGLYSLLGSRKREYPASLFYQQPWWKDFNLFNDYFARLSMVMSKSTPFIDILLLHPMSSAWALYKGNPSASEEFNKIESAFNELTSGLLGANYCFHYGDDAIIRRHGKIEGKNFVVGGYSYRTVILPPMANIDSHTLGLLEKFAQNGGAILSAGELPHLANGEKGAENLRVLDKCAAKFGNAKELVENLGEYAERPICIKYGEIPQSKKIYTRTQEYEGQICHYIANTDNANGYVVDICAKSGKNLKKLDLGSCALEDFESAGYSLRPTESLLLFETEEAAKKSAAKFEPKNAIALNGEWEIKKITENALVLDMCRYSFDGENFGEGIYILQLQKKLLNEKTNRDVTMEFGFYAEDIPESCFLLIEEPEKQNIKINGESIDPNDIDLSKWHYDKSFKKIPIGKYVKKGANKIALTRYFYLSEKVYRIKNDPTVHEAESNRTTFETELEAIYLLGDFSVEDKNGRYAESNLNSMFADCDYKLAKTKKSIDINDMTKNGLPFFAGTAYLERELEIEDFERAVLSFDHPDATVLKVFVNGEHVKDLCWEPFEAEIGGHLKKNQKNTIGIELTNSLRNLLGPHHHKGGELIAVSPHAYGTHEGTWSEEMNIVRFGAGGDIKIALG